MKHRCHERDVAPIAAHHTTDEPLARCKLASLRNQAIRAAWQLGALVRRVEHEAPEVHGRLRCAVEALQLLSARLTLEGDPCSRRRTGPGNETLRSDDPPAGLDRNAELF